MAPPKLGPKKKLALTEFAIVEVLIVKMEPSSAILSTLVDPLVFVIEKDGRHRVLEYSGRTTPKWGKDNKWRNLDAVTVFEWE